MFGIYIVEEVDFNGESVWVLAEQFTNEYDAKLSLKREYFGQGEVRKIIK